MPVSRVPDHVPREMVRDFSLFTSPGMQRTPNGDPHAAVACVHSGPPIFYSPYNTQDGLGTWVITRAADQRRVLQDAENFSSHRKLFSAALDESWPTIPLELDPPAHGVFRSLLNPLLSPKRVAELEPAVRERAVLLIDRIAASGSSCDVTKDFAFPFAVSISLRFLGLPDDRLDTFVRWGQELLHGDRPERSAAARTIVDFIDELTALRRKEPVDDFISFIVQAELEGRRLTDEEVRGIGVLVFVAGLDSVAAAIGFDLAYLARNPEDQELLRSEPERIALAAEELLRAYPPIQMLRVARKDIDFEGAPIRKGDYVSCATMIANRDPAEFECPNTVDLARENNRHAAFGYGPHRCIGSHLARREIVIALEEWLARIPAFRIKKGTSPITYGGHVFGIENLVLDWS
ncbi:MULTISPECIES: cytochrome P450 [Mesorhizobium]|uniref:Cytochrome P450 n=1 Tax=Mesorhizobium neociceri TaxID=1307853 RepID=A0A838BC79_9HYPH|nr:MULTISPECIES: cytochrome P450 [Mesorhizobium]MBA1143862.1 cytochrome P450 [Mesorhizobium neociceri]